MTRRIVVDMSDLYGFFAGDTPLSGIQRVALNFAERLRKNPDRCVSLAYFDPLYGYYSQFPEHVPLDNLEEARQLLSFSRIRRFRPEKYRNKPIRRAYHRRRIELVRKIDIHLRTRMPGNSIPRRPGKLLFEPNDVLLALGAGWDGREMFRLVEPLSRRDFLKPIALIHDLTPVVTVGGGATLARDRFEDWLRNISGYVRHFLTYSNNTKDDLSGYLERIGVRDYGIEVFRLAHEFLGNDAGPVSEDVRALAGHDYVLLVGPLAGRKNGDRLVAAWARLVDRLGPGKTPLLVFAGNSRSADLATPETSRIDGHLRFVHRPSDTELKFLYKGALFTVYPSLYEGWGLPIGESLWHGKLCVTSNTSSMPEVGGSLCDYFDPYDVADMAENLYRPIADRDYLRSREAQISRAKLIDWNQSTGHLLAAVDRLLGQ